MAKNTCLRLLVSIAAFLLVAGSPALFAAATTPKAAPRIGRDLRHGVSPRPLREVRIDPLRPSTPEPPRREAPASPRPPAGRRPIDPVLQRSLSPSAPAELLQFDGAANNDNIPFFKSVFPPPDANGAAGPDHYFQTINLVFRIFDKSGNPVLGPLPNFSLWSGLGGVCESENVNTPLVKYDTAAGRWFVSQAGFDSSDGSTHECIAVSTSSDPTGTYNRYDFAIDPSSIATSARIGIWPEAYYMTVDQFKGFADAGFGYYAFDRSAILAGAPATYQYADAGAAHPSTLWALPSDLDGATAPPAGAPNFAIALGADFLDGSPNDLIHIWKFHADFTDPGNTTFEGPVDVAIAPFAALDCGSVILGQGCVPQAGSGQLLHANPSRLMYRLAYRNFGTHESLVTNFTVDGTAGENRAAVRWFEVRDPNGAPAIFQEGTYVPDQSYRFIGSIAMDQNGNMALGYSKSDATIHPTVALTGRLVGDALGTMGAENAFFEGPNSQPPLFGFWGYYSSMAVDPTDDCTFWFTAEYIGNPSPFFEFTRVGSFKFPSCTSGPTGTLQGTVTEAGSGLPISGARVTAGASETTTDASGHYQFLALPVGTYDMTVTKFGVIPGSATGIVVTDGGTTTQDFALALAPQVLLNGVVRDGSGAGWQLYARVRVSGPPDFTPVTLFTDPVTGYYGITLVAGVSYTLASEAVVPGYEPDVRTLLLNTAAAHLPEGVVENIALTIDTTACNAPGYGLAVDGLSQSFDGGALPPGWNIVNNASGAGWSIHTGPDPCGLFGGNDTGGSGPFALVNSHCDGEVSEDTELITASVNMSALSSVQIRFRQDFNGGSPAFGELADVDVSTDGGVNWTNVLHQTVAVAGPNTQAVDVTALAAGQANVRARFHYYNAFAALWWQVDDVILGQTSCAPSPGGLVVGNVLDANTGTGLNGGTVQNVGGGPSAKTFDTLQDPAQPDGLYVLFSESAFQSFTASLDLYALQTKGLTVVPNHTQRLDFSLAAGRLDAGPRPLSARVNPGEIVDRTLAMDNTGSADASFQIHELNVPPISTALPLGPFADRDLRNRLLARIPTPALRDAGNARNIPPLSGTPIARALQAGNVVNAYPSNLDEPWGVAFDTDATDFWISNSAPFAGDNLDYRYLTDGTKTGDTIDDSAWVADFAADGAYNQRTKKLWRVNVGGDDCIYELDPAARVATGNKICPAFGTSQRGLAYNPVNDTYYSGSWTDGVIQHFDSKGTILDSAYVAVPISGLAFNASSGHLYALTNHDVLLGFDVYVFDTRNNYAVIGAFFITSAGSPVLSPFGGAGMEIDCNGHLWLVDNVAKTIYEVETQETAVCAFDEIPWLSENPTGGTVAAGSTLPVVCTFDSTGLFPGLRQGELLIPTNTPYKVSAVPVDFTVRFLDVADSNIYEAFIYAAAGAGVMPGCDPAAFHFCPTDLVTRADMAGFILRAVHGAAFVPTPYAGAFGDVSAGDYNADYIQSFFDEGYTAGCGGGNFCPTAVHTRGQTAVFILKGIHGTGYVPPPCGSTHVFDDVPCPPTAGAPFGDWIGQLFTEGITAGCGGNSYCPNAGIPNQQMATFLVKAFNLPR
ncbi:MAG: carboxypeptidase regulatory-like domain-containing protein [Thermoanaerobaculia bacterium]